MTMPGDGAYADLDPSPVLQDVIVVTADLVGRPHVGCDLQPRDRFEFEWFRQDHHLDLPGNRELGAKADVLVPQLFVECGNLLIGVPELPGSFVDELLEVFRMKADLLSHAVESEPCRSNLVARRNAHAD